MAKRATSQTVRIIGGQWRSRRLSVADVDGLRPSKDAVRETVFNWLGSDLLQATVWDLFAGTGALGLEAASRGAQEVHLVEPNKEAVAQLASHVNTLSANMCHVHHQTAQQFVQRATAKADVMFLDPPFKLNVLDDLLPILCEQHAHPHTQIYIEQAKSTGLPVLSQHWVYRREKQSGDVVFALAVRR